VRLMNKKEMVETVGARLDIGYEVTDFLTEPQEYFPVACWYVILLCTVGYFIHPVFNMITQEDREFVNFLFDKLLTHTDTDMIDLQDDDSCCDHVLFSQLELF